LIICAVAAEFSYAAQNEEKLFDLAEEAAMLDSALRQAINALKRERCDKRSARRELC